MTPEDPPELRGIAHVPGIHIVDEVHLHTPGDLAALVPGLADRVLRRMKERKVRTPNRALAEIEKLETTDVAELGVAVFVRPAPVGRVTGHEVECEEHGVMPVLAPSKSAGHLAAARHILHEHGRAGTVVLQHRPRKAS